MRNRSKFTSILIIAFAYWLLETAFFGWNLTPQTSAELLADGLAFLLVALAIAADSPRVCVRIGKLGKTGQIITISGEVELSDERDEVAP